ncbi:MAG: glycosyltransferase [Ignavibacteria bacterium]|nr:glycosyltransferase [Ignavibacteria bacterium]
MDLSVIIVNYNVRQFLENALTSVKKAMAGIRGEIFVVDNASDDGSVEMVRTRFPDVCLIANSENVGFAKANNMALVRAQGRFLLLLNPDTLVQEDTFEVMLRFFERHVNAGLAGCKILNPDGSLQLACRRSFPTPWVALTRITGLSTLFPRSRFFGRYNLTYLNPDETHEVEAISGSFMMMRREVYTKVGGLDEAFFMYGEDLDWCYRVSEAGFGVYYVHNTQIVHFKGESTRRSTIDEISMFYEAMQIFVDKHFSTSLPVKMLLSLGILLRAAVAFIAKIARAMFAAVADVLVVALAMILAELLYFGDLFRYPLYAYPIVWTVPGLVVALSCYFSGVYGVNRNAIARAAFTVVVSFVIISATVFFAKDFAFSRAVVIIAGALSFIFVPGWRLAFRLLGIGSSHVPGRKTLFGRRTIIVGTGESARELLRRLRARVDDGYDVVGFIDVNRKRIGERISGLEVIGSIDTVGKVITEHRVSEVIFSMEGLTYSDILSVIGRSNDLGVNFRLVPNSLEAIIGKTRIDELDTIPLVEIEYNIHRASNRALKRVFDIVVALLLLVLCYPWVRLMAALRGRSGTGPRARTLLLVPQVLIGHLSFVGRPLGGKRPEVPATLVGEGGNGQSYLGPFGLTGLVQINRREDLTAEEIERYLLYYAKNQSLLLDIEILLKALVLSKR